MGRLTTDPIDDYPNLSEVLGGYLNQDFRLDFDSPDAALRAAATGQGSGQVSAAIREIDTLLESTLDDEALDQILDRLTANGYSPSLDGCQMRPWLQHARALLEDRLEP
jgi:hypothetical protein